MSNDSTSDRHGGVARLFGSKIEADVRIVCPNGFIIAANKSILAANCEFFKNAFDSKLGFTEASTGTIKLEDPGSAVESMIEYFYNGDYDTDHFVNQQAANEDNLTDFVGPLSHHFKVYVLGDKYLVPDLKEAAYLKISPEYGTNIEDFLEAVVWMNDGGLEPNEDLLLQIAAKAVRVTRSDHDTTLLWQQKGIADLPYFLFTFSKIARRRAQRGYDEEEEERRANMERPTWSSKRADPFIGDDYGP